MERKYLAISLVIIVMLSAFMMQSASAQQDQKRTKNPEEMATKKADRLKAKLSLSEDQYKQVYSIFLENANRRIAEKEKMKGMDKTTRKEMKMKHKQETMDKLQAVLTKEQMLQFEQMKEKGKKRNKNKSNNPNN
ncbi:MAG: hypothetical protein IPG02_16030 [Ignavibacteria bacterium]|jgi:hypothetical protein|nr:hypothetical protein [Ignavibacteria bacterium]MBK6878593.1 hypothetical protein [Ignavibacteria bacterium]